MFEKMLVNEVTQVYLIYEAVLNKSQSLLAHSFILSLYSIYINLH